MTTVTSLHQSTNKKNEKTEETLYEIGRNIRRFRVERGMTLKMLGAATGLSTSMLSLVERGRSSPSIGSLITICSALGKQMSDLIVQDSQSPKGHLSRVDDQPVISTMEGVARTILRDDRSRGIEIAINNYESNSGSSEQPLSHAGHEYGIVLDGSVVVEVGTSRYELKQGDLVSYDSRIPHRIWNFGKKRARALWVNHDRNR